MPEALSFIDARTLFCAGVIPALLVVTAVLAGRAWRDGRERWAALPAVAMAAGAVGAMLCLVPDLSVLPPTSGWYWLFWIAVGVGVVGGVDFLLPRRPVVVLVVGAIVTVIAYYLLARFFILRPTRPWTGGQAAVWIGLSSAASILAMLTGHLLTQRMQSVRPAACAMAAVAGVAALGVGFLGRSEQLANVAGVPAACAAALAGLAIFVPALRLGPSAWFALALLGSAVTTVAMEAWYSYLPLTEGILLLAAPLGAWAAVLADRGRWYAPAVLAVVGVLPMLAVPLVRAIETIIAYRELGFM